MVNWCLLDEYSLLQIFSYLSINDLAHVSKVCQSWYLVASDDSLWRSLFLRRFSLKKATLPHFSKTWKSELRRILWTIPCPEIKFARKKAGELGLKPVLLLQFALSPQAICKYSHPHLESLAAN